MKRSDNWKNIFDPSTGYVRPRRPNGEWIENTNPYHAPGFCEGSAWQFTWYVPHDVKSLINLIGERQFIDRLNAGFATSEKVSFNALGDNMGAYPINHGNETNMQAAYLFSYTSEPWHTQKWARAIQEKYYGMGTRRLSGRRRSRPNEFLVHLKQHRTFPNGWRLQQRSCMVTGESAI